MLDCALRHEANTCFTAYEYCKYTIARQCARIGSTNARLDSYTSANKIAKVQLPAVFSYQNAHAALRVRAHLTTDMHTMAQVTRISGTSHAFAMTASEVRHSITQLTAVCSHRAQAKIVALVLVVYKFPRDP